MSDLMAVPVLSSAVSVYALAVLAHLGVCARAAAMLCTDMYFRWSRVPWHMRNAFGFD